MSSMVEDSFESFQTKKASFGKHTKHTVKHSARDSDYSSSMGTAEDLLATKSIAGRAFRSARQRKEAAQALIAARARGNQARARANALRATSKLRGAVFLGMFHQPAR